MNKAISITVIGYGSQGRAWTLNLIDSGIDMIVGIPARDPSRRQAKKDGIKNVATIPAAVKKSSVIVFAFPDHLHGDIFENNIKPDLNKGSALVFLHGFSIHFKTVIPPDDCDIILLAPLGPGIAVREKYLKSEPIGFFHCIHSNATGNAPKILDHLVSAMQIDRKAMIKTTFEDEAVGDLFGEQAVLCGGLSRLIMSGFETLVESGLSPDKAYLEVAYQLDLIIDLIKKYGIEGMHRRISVAAKYGSYLSGPRIVDTGVKKRMKKLLGEIKRGDFARKFNNLTPDKIEELDKNLPKLSSPAFEKSARKFSPKG